jgi:hypothetical protein
MSSYRDPTLRGDVYPSEEEIDPTGAGLLPEAGSAGTGPTGTAPTPTPTPQPGPTPGPVPAPPPSPGPPPRVDGGRTIVTHHLDGSTEIATDLTGNGVADVVQFDLDGDGVPDITYLDSDRDGRLDTVLREPEAARPTG